MTDFSPTISSDLLLSHRRFVHAIARDLLRDEHAAEDVVQDTWVQALQRGPRTLVALRSWLVRVTTNRARDVQRANVRRQRREQDAVASAATEPVGDTAARLALQHDVVGAVLGLGEPYKTVVLLRYYQGLEPTEIAARLGSKPATVRTQLVRAHEQLRERLDRDHGGRAAWAALLLPALMAPARTGTTLMTIALAATSVLVAVFGFLAWRSEDPVPPVPVAVATVAQTSTSAATDAPTPDPMPVLRMPVVVRGAQGPPPATIPEVIGPRAVLCAQTGRSGYAGSAFSFLHAYGGRERQGKDKARGDYDVAFANDRLRADCVSDDRSLIVDLGELRLSELTRVTLDDAAARVGHAAELRYGRRTPPQRDLTPSVALGHTYFVWTQDTDSDHAAVCEVVDLPAKDTCVLEWYWTEDGTWARGSMKSPAGVRTLAAAVIALRDAARPFFERELERRVGPREMRQPRIVLQARSGAAGGNPCRIDIGRNHTMYFDQISRDPLALTSPIAIHDDAIGHCSGGLIPVGVKLVITSVAWSGEAHGDTNGSGCFHVQLGDHELAKVEKSDTPIRGSWAGRVELVRGEEDLAYFEISNSSQGEVIFTGTFENLPK